MKRILPIGLFVLPMLLGFFGCSSSPDQELPRIQLYQAHQQRQQVKLSLFGKSIEYVLLETNKQCLISDWTDYFLDGDLIVVIGFRYNYLFDRKTGRFLREIGHFGNDPGGYRATPKINSYNYRRHLIRTYGWDLDTYYIYPIKPGQEFLLKTPRSVVNTVELVNGNYLGYVRNYEGSEKRRLVEFSANDTTHINMVPNFHTFLDTGASLLLPYHGSFYEFDDQTYFYESYTDTIFRYASGTITGHLILDRGKLGPTYEQQGSGAFIKNLSSYALPHNFQETSRWVVCRYILNNVIYYYCIFDKKNGTTYVTNSDKQTMSGFENDIDCFVSFPLSSINPDGYAIGAVEAGDVIQWMDSTRMAPPEEIAYSNKLSENANPLIMIVKIKD